MKSYLFVNTPFFWRLQKKDASKDIKYIMALLHPWKKNSGASFNYESIKDFKAISNQKINCRTEQAIIFYAAVFVWRHQQLAYVTVKISTI